MTTSSSEPRTEEHHSVAAGAIRASAPGRVFLDAEAFSQSAEYRRFLDGDYLGKLLFKSFLVRRVGLAPDSPRFSIPLSRYGELGSLSRNVYDASFFVDDIELKIELKLARVNIADATRRGQGRPGAHLGPENWAFNKLLKTPAGVPLEYDVAVAIGVLTLGPENPEYWAFENEVQTRFAELGVRAEPEAMPHEPAYLNRCGFFIFDRNSIDTNYFRINIRTIPQSNRYDNFAWGHDIAGCRALWDAAIHRAISFRRDRK